MKMTIELNGDAFQIEQGLDLQALLESLDLRLRRVAVEINQEVVPKAEYGRTVLSAGDKVEIISFVGGG